MMESSRTALTTIDSPLLARGNVWKVNFEPVEGHEQGRVRPAIIVSASGDNTVQRGLVTVIPLTTKLKKRPYRLRILPDTGGLPQESDALCDQPRTVSHSRLIEHIGVVTENVMGHVSIFLRIYLDI